ncbi:hypothetical protein EMPS_04303 [Entomortierella parvispora]|uniref:RRM domain-containing protein n=1 Tax=Entomortierella parvispora TaxID=205924 RepID=A0A9P3H886_9FUNG|nr:hypothetical protein EMPS_04303 [Entomortierella parvispora]
MKRSNDYQSHDAFKKPRVAHGYNNNSNNSNNNNYPTHGGMAGGMGSMGGAPGDMYGAYGSSQMMMGNYGQMPNPGQYGTQFGGEHAMAMAPYQAYPAPAFGTPYANVPFQMSFPPNGAPGLNTGIRTLYIGNLPQGTTVEEVLSLVRTGIVESARILPEKNCAFVAFMEPSSAAAFHQEASSRKPSINGQEVRVGWGKASVPPPNIVQAVQQGATRNVFIGNVDDSITEQSLHEDCMKYGVIDSIKILREKNIAFVHFASISSAMKAVAGLPLEATYAGRRVNYGKDRCAKSGPNNQGGAGAGGAFTFGAPQFPQYGSAMPLSFNPNFDRFPPGGRQNGGGPASVGGGNSESSAVPMETLFAERKRTVYLGSIGPETTCEDLCNSIRGGILSNIRFFPQKHMAFVTFVDPQAAETFVNQANQLGLMIKSRRLKVGWGQNAHSLTPPVIQAIRSGATRNVYLGGLSAMVTEETLRRDFSEFGEIELVNLLKEKNCGFVNFTNILSAVQAIEGIRRNPEYATVKINYGKDRCGNAPKPNRINLNANNNNGGHGANGGNNTGNSSNNGSSGGHSIKAESSDAEDIKNFDLDDEMFQV